MKGQHCGDGEYVIDVQVHSAITSHRMMHHNT